jgi:fatty acid-binding protein DegV
MQTNAVNGRVRVVTDDTAALDPRIAAAYRVRIVPMVVEEATQPLADAESARELPVRRILTSAPSPGTFLAAIKEPPAPAGVVIVTVAGALSAAHRAAALAAHLSASSGGPPVGDCNFNGVTPDK